MGAFQERIKVWAPPDWGFVKNLGTLLESVGLTLDGAMERFQLSRAASLVKTAGGFDACEPEVIPYHAQDRGLRLYATEPDESQRARLAKFRQLHQRRATHRGELEHAHPYFLPGALPTMRIVHQVGDGASAVWHTVDPNGVYSMHEQTPSNWNFDGMDEQFTRWWVILCLSGTRIDDGITYYDDGSTYDGGQIYDGLAQTLFADMIDLFKDWKAAHSMMWGLILVRNPGLLQPDGLPVGSSEGWTTYPVGNWGYLVDPATNKPTRDPRLDFIYDLGHG